MSVLYKSLCTLTPKAVKPWLPSRKIVNSLSCNTVTVSSRAHSPTFPSLHLRHNSFSNLSVALPRSQLILQPFRPFIHITAHSPTFPSLHLRHDSFFNPSVASPTSQFILQPLFLFSYVTSSSLNSPGEPPMIWLLVAELTLQPFRHFTYITTHFQLFRCFTYVTVHSPTLISLLLRHKLFT